LSYRPRKAAYSIGKRAIKLMSAFSMRNHERIEEIKTLYRAKKGEIFHKLEEFKGIWDRGTDEEIFAELVYCIITPMARGKMCCAAVDAMVSTGIIFTGTRDQIKGRLIGARFIHKKSAYIVEAREKFLQNESTPLRSILGMFGNDHEARQWLVEQVKGIGYKEASHFLRNIGFTRDLAILDRHILRNLQLFGAIEEIPETLSKRRYLEIEKRMREFSDSIRIPMAHLDLLLWYKGTGEILK
jgi:N-glycosylase/DNA lyase